MEVSGQLCIVYIVLPVLILWEWDEPQSQSGPWDLNLRPSLFFIHLCDLSVPTDILAAVIVKIVVIWGVMLHCAVDMYLSQKPVMIMKFVHSHLLQNFLNIYVATQYRCHILKHTLCVFFYFM
jgi:hypothetical protein